MYKREYDTNYICKQSCILIVSIQGCQKTLHRNLWGCWTGALFKVECWGSWMLRKLNAEKVECWGSGCNKWARTRKTSPFTGISCYNLPKGNRERSDDLQFIRTLFEWLSTIDTQLHTISHSALSTLSMDISSNLWHILPILTQKMKTIWFFFNFILSHQPISRTFQ